MKVAQEASGFINARRVCWYGLAMAGFFAIVYGSALRESFWAQPDGKPLFLDFGIFWAVSRLVEQGQAVLAYQSHIIGQSMVGFMGEARPVGFGWFYPPTYFLLIWPLGYLSPSVAYGTFMTATGGLYFSALVKTLPGRATGWAVLGFSGFWLNLMMGQNGFLSAGLLGWALYFLKCRPVIAGIFLGLLTFKPHLGMIVPLALILGRQWRCLISATVTFLVLAGLSVVLFGWDAWQAWEANFALARMNLAQTDPDFLVKLTSVFVVARLLGFSEGVSYFGQMICSLIVISVLWTVWRSSLPLERKYPTLVLAALLVTPYVFEYDLTWIGVAGVWWIRSHRGERITAIDQVLAVLLWLLPELVYLVAQTRWIIPVAQGVIVVALMRWAYAESITPLWKNEKADW